MTVTGVDSPPVADDGQDYTVQDYRVALTVDRTGTQDSIYDGLSALTVYVRNRDSDYGLAVGEVSGQATEAGGKATFTVALWTQPSAAVTVAVSGRDGSEGTAAPASLTFAPSAWNTARTVTVTGVQDVIDDGTVTWAVRLDPSSGDADYDGLDGKDVSVSTTDDDGPPGVVLSLAPASVSENGGTATVTARLSHPSSAATTLTVAAAAGTGAGAADFTLGTKKTLTIAAGAWASTGVVTVTANDDTVDSPDKSVTVTATVTNDRAAADSTTMAVTGASLTLTDDDAAPAASLSLAPETVSENGGTSTVTAVLSHPSSEPSTVTVAAVAGLYTVGSDATIVIAAGSRAATSDTVLVTALDDDVHQGTAGRSGTVTATLANGQGAGAVTGAALTLEDADDLPRVSLVLSPASISETGGRSTVTVRLTRASSEAVTVTVAAAAVASTGAVAADFAQVGTTLTIAAGSTASTGTVTVTAYSNAVDSPDKTVTVSGTATGGNGVADPPNRALTLTDDDEAPRVSLVLSPASVSETGGRSTVTVRLTRASSEAVTVTVAAAAVASTGAVAADFAQVGTTLTIEAGSTASTGTVTVIANGNDVDAPNKRVAVSGTATGGGGVANPRARGLTLTDDDTAGISVSPANWSTRRLVTTESAGTATFTVELDSEPTGNVVFGVASSDTDEGTVAPSVLTFTPSDWDEAQTVTLTGVDDSPPAADGSQNYTVTLTVNRTDTQDSVYDALSALTVYARNRDNEYGLAIGEVSGQATEAGGAATFTVALWTQPSAAVTVAVSSRDGSEGTVAPPSLTFAPSAWSTAQTVTVTGVQDTFHDGTVTWAVRLDPSSGDAGYDALDGEEVLVTTTDDDPPWPNVYRLPDVVLSLSPASVSENGGVSTVTARWRAYSVYSTRETTVTVAAAPGTGAVAADFTLSAKKTLTLAARARAGSTGVVTVTANDNTVDSPDKSVTVTATVNGSPGYQVRGGRLILTDDDAAPTAALSLDPTSVSEYGGVSTVTATLSHPSSEPSTVTVTAVSGFYTVGSDAAIVIAAGSRAAASDTVLVTALDDDVHQGTAGRSGTVTATLANGQGAGAVTGASLALTDNETLPTVVLVLSDSSVSETGGVSTVTARLSGKSGEALTVAVAAAAGTGAVAADFTLSGTTLTIAAGATTSAGTVTVTANPNDVHSPSKSVTVSGTAAGGHNVADPPDAALTLEDDDALPTVALVLSPSSISETDGISAVAATLSGPIERGGDGDGGRGGGSADGGGRLHPEHGEDPDHRGGGDDEHRDGDGDRRAQRRGRGEKVGGRLGDGGGRQRGRRPVERDPDPDGRRLGVDRGVAVDVGDEPAGDDGVGRDGDVHGGAEQRADGGRGARRGELGHGRGHGGAAGPDLHVGRLGHGADGDADRGG